MSEGTEYTIQVLYNGEWKLLANAYITPSIGEARADLARIRAANPRTGFRIAVRTVGEWCELVECEVAK